MSLYCGGDYWAPGRGRFHRRSYRWFNALMHHDAAANAWSQRIRNPISFAISLVLLTLNFAGGVTANITYNATDWNQNSTPRGPAAIGNLGRNENVGATGTSFTYGKPVPFALYETDINLASLGLQNLTLQSVTFNGLAGTAAVTGIFALSAGPVPEPSTLALCTLGGLGLLCLAWRRSRLAV